MNKFAKKSLSGVLAMIMALSTLTVGAASAFAADKYVWTQYSAAVTATNDGNDDVKAGTYTFAPEVSGYYAIKLSSEPVTGKTRDDISSSYVNMYIQDEKNPDEIGRTAYFADSYDDDEYGSSSRLYDGSMRTVYAPVSNGVYKNIYDYEDVEITVPADKTVLAKNKVYVPGCSTTYLNAGNVYQFVINTGLYAKSTFSIDAVDFRYNYTAYSNDITVNAEVKETYNYDKGEYEYSVVEGGRTYKDYTVGIGASIYSYDGISTAVNVPEKIDGYEVKTVSLSGTTYELRKRITAVTLPNCVERISGMNNMYKLSYVNIPTSLKEIGSDCFENDRSLSGEISLPESVKEVGSYAFYNTGISKVKVSNAETEFYYNSFGYTEVLNDATADPTDVKPAQIPGFTVIAPAQSLAAQYAVNNGFVTYDPAVCNEGVHYYTSIETPATVFSKGKTVYTCGCCGATTTRAIAKKKLAIKSLKAAKSAFTVKVAKHSEAKGYQIQYSTSKKFTKKTTKTVTVKTNKALSKKVTGLKKGKYYVRVRAYKTSGKKTVYSKYSAVKSVKVK